MKITWLGQAGLLLEKGNIKVMVDPYLSDSVYKINPANHRRMPVDETLFAMTPDVMLFTHNHLDHYDTETAPRFFAKTDKKMTILCPTSVWGEARKHGNGHNYVQFNRHTVWTEHGLRFTAVKAEHSDDCAIGVIVEELDSGKKYYITGDTLYNTAIFADLPDRLTAILLPINGVGNNMNAVDASDFATRSGAKFAIPLHFGLFDSLDPMCFKHENRIIPTIYQSFEL